MRIRAEHIFIYMYVCLYISVKVSALLPSNSEKQSMNVWRSLEQNLHTSGKFACRIQFQLQCSSIFTGYRTISPESFPFLPEIFFVKDCIEKITCFVTWSKICIHQESLRAGSNFNCNVHQYSLDTELPLQNLFPFFQKSFLVKDCIEEITRFVTAVK